MQTRETVITELPQELLQLIFLISITDEYACGLSLRTVNHLFFDVMNVSAKKIMQNYLGPYENQILKYMRSHSYVGLFGKIQKGEVSRLKVVDTLAGIDISGMVIARDDKELPRALDYFIISAIATRAYNDLQALLEQIRLSHCELVSYSRVKESICLQALLSYNEIEFVRLSTFVPIGVNEKIGYLDGHEYKQLPLIYHAARFGNCNLVKYLAENEAEYSADLLDYLDAKLKKQPGHYHWHAIYLYLLERMSPQVAPPDWPGPL